MVDLAELLIAFVISIVVIAVVMVLVFLVIDTYVYWREHRHE